MKKRLLCTVGLLALAGCASSPTSPGSNLAHPSASAQPSGSPAPQASATAAPSATPSAAPSASATTVPTRVRPAPILPTPSPSAPDAAEPDIYDLRNNFFSNYLINPFVEASTDPLSTFAADVDTASYTITRGYLNASQLPPPAAVRTEEFLNYFNYHYPQPLNGKFAIYTDLSASYFGDPDTRLLRVGIQGQEILEKNRKQANLTFVIDVSGSMNRENRLELVKKSLLLLMDQLGPNDRVGLVVYGTTARVALEPTSISNKALITSVINTLRPEGSTNAEAGLQLAYSQASTAFKAW
ncbi:MAG TPA: von Willebrand factor type A domain-containing protein, partial [Candidatus Obscuribacterales bacterium]